MKTIFEKIVDGEIPSYKIWEDEKHLAFLDIMPIQNGQILVIPKKPTDYIFDMSDKEYSDLLLAAKKVAIFQKIALSANRIAIVVEGLEVPHVHIKLIPVSLDHLTSAQPHPVSQDYLKDTQAKIKSYIESTRRPKT